MAGRQYIIKGKLTTPVAGRAFNALKMVAYKFISASSMQVYGNCAVDASGHYRLEFTHGTETNPAIEVHVMPVPAVIEKFGVFNIERTVVGIYFPKAVISPGDWHAGGDDFKAKASMEIPAHIWRRWDWLSEEFTVIGRVVKKEVDAFLPVPFCQVWAADVDAPRPNGSGVGGAQTDAWGHFTITFRRIAFFIDYARRIHLPVPKYRTEAWPDLIFNITQVIGGVKEQIYSESARHARPRRMWDVRRRILYVNLVTEKGVTNDESYPPIPENFLFHGIGVVDAHCLHDGYATTGPTDDLRNRKDCPFGGSLHIKGQFDTAGPAVPRYYQVLYAKWNGAGVPAEGDFTPILNESWTVSKYDAASRDWDPLAIEPIGGVVPGEKVYEIPDYTDHTQTKKTRLIRWNTRRNDAGVRRYPDGKYDLLIKAWDDAGNPVSLNPLHADTLRLTVVLDNTKPQALLRRLGPHDILRTDEMEPFTPVCPVYSKIADGPLMAVVFDATDTHFRQYRLSFITGHNFRVDEVEKYYRGTAGPKERFAHRSYHRAVGSAEAEPFPHPDDDQDPGGFPGETIAWNIGSPDVVRCAYQVRLKVWGRTINGYGYIHRTEDTMHFSIEP